MHGTYLGDGHPKQTQLFVFAVPTPSCWSEKKTLDEPRMQMCPQQMLWFRQYQVGLVQSHHGQHHWLDGSLHDEADGKETLLIARSNRTTTAPIPTPINNSLPSHTGEHLDFGLPLTSSYLL